MKKQFLFLALVAISFFACTKTDEEVIAEAIEIIPSTIGSKWEVKGAKYYRDGSIMSDWTDTSTIVGTIKVGNVQYGIMQNTTEPYGEGDTTYFTYSNSKVLLYEKLSKSPYMTLFIPKTNGESITTDSSAKYDYYTQQNIIALVRTVGYTATTIVNNIACYKNIEYYIQKAVVNGSTISDTSIINITYFKPGLGIVADSSFGSSWQTDISDTKLYLESTNSYKKIK